MELIRHRDGTKFEKSFKIENFQIFSHSSGTKCRLKQTTTAKRLLFAQDMS